MEDNLFIRSPFALTASPDVAACWAGRKDLLDQLTRIQTSYSRRGDSSLDLMWANLGAGKSHVMYHLASRLRLSSNEHEGYLPIVVEMPEQLRGFHDMYRQIISKIPINDLSVALTNLPSSCTFRELKQAGQILAYGSEQEKEMTWEWVTGGRPHLTELKRCTNIGRRIEDDLTAVDSLCGILTAFGARRVRIVLLVDEFQRIGILKRSARDALMSSLRSVFSRTPEFFSVLLGAALRMEKNALDLLSSEMRTLLGRRPTLSLPELSESEALEFLRERFLFFRPVGFCGEPFTPFSEEGVVAAISLLKEKGRQLIPRELLQALAYCYDESSWGSPIGEDDCRKLLGDLQWDDV